MRTIKPVAVLDYYDGIQIFEGRDSIGGHYIAVLIDSVGSAYRYVATGANPERLRQFRVGDLDLRTLLLEAPGGEWFFIYADAPYGESLTLLPQEGPLADRKDLLPGPNLTLDDSPIDDLAEKLATESNNTVLEFSLEPPESAYEHRVRADTLGEILTRAQNVMKYAYRSALRELPKSRTPNRAAEDGYLMDVVVPAAPGSFRVILKSAAHLDDPNRPQTFEPGELVKGLMRMDEVFQSAIDPDNAQKILLRHKGHLATAYINLLQILAERNTSFNYSWADPMVPGSRYGGVSAAVAKRLYKTLSESVDISEEVVELEGEFVQMDLKTGTWRLRTDAGDKRGKIGNGGPSLEGLIAGYRYKFICIDEIEINASGRESHALHLYYLESLSAIPDAHPNNY